MTVHVCRDFPSNTLAASSGDMCLYYLAIFCRTCLGFTTVGQTNFDIDAVYAIARGSNGTLNLGVGSEYAFQPDAYVVKRADVGRILALRSNGNGFVNSGLFRVTGVDVIRNLLFVDYRSIDVPPSENAMVWTLYENELAFTNTIDNGASGNGLPGVYMGWSDGANTTDQPRIILQCPSSLGWQVRLTVENFADTLSQGGSVTVFDTIAPGYGGNSNGDFTPGGDHLHAPLFFNRATTGFAGMTGGWVGGFPVTGVTGVRAYIWGDDVTGNVVAVSRSVIPNTSAGDSWCMFGIPLDEESAPLPRPIHRLFAMTATATDNSNQNGAFWASGPQQEFSRGGVAFGFCNQPISCVFSTYGLLATAASTGKIRNDPNAGDNPYLNAIELIPVDLVAGTYDQMRDRGALTNGGSEFIVSEVRRMGRAPFARLGRSNYGYFQTVNDRTNSWLHISDGIYLPWRGNVLP